jgi:Leucine-rich repeat (LRR) protein
MFQKCSKLEYLNLSHNRLGEVAGLLLGPAIAENTTLKELNISSKLATDNRFKK